MSIRHVLLVTNELATVSAVSSALKSNGELSEEDVCRDFGELTARLDRQKAPAVLVDIDSDREQRLAALEPLARRFADTRFVVLGATMQNDLLLGAMQAGARHFILKDSIATDLNRVLKQLCPDSGNGSLGSAVTVLSAGGGCGATTIAVNLAAELQLRGGKSADPALIVDLDPCYGAVAAYLGVEGEYGLFDVMAREGSIDAQLVRSSSLSRSPSLHALISVPRERLGEPVAIESRRLGQAIDACKSAYAWTVVDAPRIGPTAAAELVRHSTVSLLLLQLTVKDIRAARRILAALEEQGIHKSAIGVLATRYRRRRMLIDPREARQALGLADGQVLGIMSNDYYAVAGAVNLGKPLAQTAPRSNFRRDVQKLAASIAARASVPVADRSN